MAVDSLSTHHRGILQHIRDLMATGRGFTLCVVVHTTGSTYRKAGAMAIVGEDGVRRGVISGGCLESDLEVAAVRALRELKPRLLVFDTNSDDDELFGSGSGCRGTMQVLLLPAAAGISHPLCQALLAADDQHQSLKAALVIRGQRIGSGMLWSAQDRIELGPHQAMLDPLQASPPGEYPLPDEASCAVFALQPSPSILLIGSGPEAPGMIQTAGQMGWRVAICDHREELLKRHAAGADRILCARPAQAIATLSDQPFDACVVMTHTLANDREALLTLSSRPVRFIGLLGPPGRRDGLLNELSPSVTAALHGRLHAPVGIQLGGYGPEVLALSVCAQLQHFLAADAQATAWTETRATDQRRA